MVTKTTTQPVAEEKSEVTETAPVEEPAPAPAAVTEEAPAPAPQPVAEEPQAPVATPAPQTTSPTVNSTQLPKTATYAPVMGFSGLLAFGLYSLLRLKRA